VVTSDPVAAARDELDRLLNAFPTYEFDPETDVLVFQNAGGPDHRGVIDPVALLRRLEQSGEGPYGATFVMSGTPLEAAAKLLMVHIDEDLQTGKDPYRKFAPTAEQQA
jgi:hypothetical protein